MSTRSITLAYGKTDLTVSIDEENLGDILRPRYPRPDRDGAALVKAALDAPIGSPALRELSAAAKKIVVITNDHTRPMPSDVTLPLLLDSLARPAASYDITFLIANGLHRAMTEAEIREKLGPVLYGRYPVENHDALDDGSLCSLGTLPTGTPLFVNRRLVESDLVLAEGYIEPHFFAGFSGGRKSLVPGVAGAQTILANHCPSNIADPGADIACLAGNPIHLELTEAVRHAPLHFILNIAMDDRKNILAAFAGHPEHAHAKGCEFVAANLSSECVPAPIVVASNDGYPLDRNLYQAVKGMAAAQKATQPGGVIILAAQCADGVGHPEFHKFARRYSSAGDLYDAVNTGASEIDKWQIQVLARILRHHKIILVSDGVSRQTAGEFFLDHAASVEEALEQAYALKGRDARVNVIPNGPAVIARPINPCQKEVGGFGQA